MTHTNKKKAPPVARLAATARKSLGLAVIGVATALSGCASTGSCRDYIHKGFKVGPDYCKPATPIADAWIDQYDGQVRTELPNYADWWTVFNDPTLDGLMEETYQQNLTLKSAGLRVLQARYLRSIAVGGFFPQQQEAFGSYTRTQNSKSISGGALPRTDNLWTGGFGVFWEVDFWGKFRRNIESADASLDASVEDYDAILTCLLAETASSYIDLRTAQQRLQYAQDNVTIQQRSMKSASVRYKAGEENEMDPLQAQNVVASTQQLIPLYESQIRAANNRLCVLLGTPTRDLTPELGVGPIPTPPADVVVGMPANLLRRRPDVRAAERQVAAQSAAIGVATADLLPHLSIVGAIALDAEKFSDLFRSASTAGSISPGFTWDILNYGRLVNNVNLQDALFQQLAVDYQQTVLQANAEVESGIYDFLKSKERLQYVNQAVTASRSSLDIAVVEYEKGATDFNRVFSLQTALVQDQDTYAVVQGNVAQSLVTTYKALGGGWEIRYGIRRGATGGTIETVTMPNAGMSADEPVTPPDVEPDNVQPDNVPEMLDVDMLPPVPEDDDQ